MGYLTETVHIVQMQYILIIWLFWSRHSAGLLLSGQYGPARILLACQLKRIRLYSDH